MFIIMIIMITSTVLFRIPHKSVVREWSLITGRGGYKTGGGGREVLPLRKGGAEKVLAMLKGGHKKFWGRLYAVA